MANANFIIDLTALDDDDDTSTAQTTMMSATSAAAKPIKKEPQDDDESAVLFVRQDHIGEDQEFSTDPGITQAEMDDLFRLFARDADVSEEEDEPEREATPEETPDGGAKKPSKKGPGRPKKATATPKQRKKSSKKRKARDAPLNVDLDHMLGTNMFNDLAATSHLPAGPVVRGGNKAATLQQLRRDAGARAGTQTYWADTKMLDDAIKSCDGKQRVRAVPGGYDVLGMKVILHPYQVVGVGFMRRLEKARGPNDPQGGILADTMGLGKTIMMLANIVNGQPTSVRARAPTLIVASPGLLAQWYDEIHKHVEIGRGTNWGIRNVGFFRDLATLHGRTLKTKLEQQDIVLVSYQSVAKSFPTERAPGNLITRKQKDAWFKELFNATAGVLHRINWHRVILDEAHAIKNADSNTSRACCALKAEHHWAITGTPVLNTIGEFYPYLRFIRDPCVTTRSQFLSIYCDPEDQDSAGKLQTLLNRVMLRRTHATTMFGARLVNLPPVRQIVDVGVTLSTFEQNVYNIVQARFVERINAVLKEDDTHKHRHIFCLFLRLRQLTGHIYLIQDALHDLLTLDDYHKLERVCRRTREHGIDKEAVLAQMQLMKMLEDAKKTRSEQGSLKVFQSKSTLLSLQDVTEHDYDDLGYHGTDPGDASAVLESMRQDHTINLLAGNTTCAYCNRTPEEPHVTSCSHVYCLACIRKLQTKAAHFGRDHAICHVCAEAFTGARPCKTTPEPEIGTQSSQSKKRKRQAIPDAGDWSRMPGALVPSSKTKAMVATIKSWLKDDPAVKIIVYSQFRRMLRIMTRICTMERWTYVRYSGDMSTETRVNAINKFSSPGQKIQIMLASLKFGGQGLNLTAAARVLLMDSWWNDSIEQQAFSRVYRIGQEKETQMMRLKAVGTIDDYMFDMKERKQKEIDPVIENRGDKIIPLEELLKAVGTVLYDEDGKPYLASKTVDDDDDEEMGME